ncbi:TPA: hypothetical protein ACH3X2_012004 [Trebouxia sp. C0005]
MAAETVSPNVLYALIPYLALERPKNGELSKLVNFSAGDAVADWADEAQVRKHYYPEAHKPLKRVAGVTRVNSSRDLRPYPERRRPSAEALRPRKSGSRGFQGCRWKAFLASVLKAEHSSLESPCGL